MRIHKHFVFCFLLFCITDLAMANEECRNYASYDNKKICLSSTQKREVVPIVEPDELLVEEGGQLPLPIFVNSEEDSEGLELLEDIDEVVENN